MALLILFGTVQIVGICVLGYIHLQFLNRMSKDIRMITMFRKSRTVQDIAALKALGLHSEDWDKEEEGREEEEEEAEEEVRSVDELSEDALEKLRETL